MVEVRAPLSRPALRGGTAVARGEAGHGSERSLLRPGASRCPSLAWLSWARHGGMGGRLGMPGTYGQRRLQQRLDGATLGKRAGQPNTMKATATASAIAAWDEAETIERGGNKAGQPAAQRLRATSLSPATRRLRRSYRVYDGWQPPLAL